jgi:predicted enzyme related to lactoylglutathione lyase
MSATRYVHTNLIAADWQRLARFYCDVFGCGLSHSRSNPFSMS